MGQKGKGTDNQAATYCKKDGKFEEFGDKCNQGERTDLRLLVEDISSGKKSCEEIIINAPMSYHVYGRTLEKAEDLYKRTVQRDFSTTGEWVYGGTGTGKSSYAFRERSTGQIYKKCLGEGDLKWWDGYNGHRTIVLDEFRGELEFSFLLSLMDWVPLNLPRRCREPIPCLARNVIITSCYHPAYIYKKETQKTMKQLYRRCSITIMHIWEGASCLVAENYVAINTSKITYD